MAESCSNPVDFCNIQRPYITRSLAVLKSEDIRGAVFITLGFGYTCTSLISKKQKKKEKERKKIKRVLYLFFLRSSQRL